MPKKKVTQSSLSLVDIAGLMKGASQGKILRKKFQNDIKPAKLIFYVIWGLIDSKITHVENGLIL